MCLAQPGHVAIASATAHPLPDDGAHAVVTDPPYYDAVPYAHLSDFFYVWLRRSVGAVHPVLLKQEQVPKEAEIVVDRPHELSTSTKDIDSYERALGMAFAEARRVLRPDGIGVIVFASKTTASWEAILQAVVDAGWTITGSWPIDTEREARVSAQGQARLGSSVHLVCRPRENADGTVPILVGDWRDILSELPKRMHEWMPRLDSEGVVGADAIFACLGPALEIFSRYARVEKANGDTARLLPVAERTKHLFGKDTEAGPTGGKKAKKKEKQLSLFEEMEEADEAEASWKELKGPQPGTTMLDRLHQAMILFGAQRGELLKRFLVEEGVGKDARFWKLAQSLAALYPPGTDERRWVEGVLARKKGLGL
jgi:hypothetical protein